MALKGVRVLELAGLAPVPFCGMILADFGADVIRVDRVPKSSAAFSQEDNLARGKRSIAIELKSKEGQQLLLKLIKEVDVLIEPFRPGVMESLGLGPDVALAANPRLIYARLTGFGQTGPYSKMAGHDINYIAMSGTLATFGRKGENPIFPGNILGDFAAGGLLCAFGIVTALYERFKSGKGQVIDSAMMDGSLYLGTFIYKATQNIWGNPRGENLLDSGAHFYETYETKDGKYIAVGALEPHFYNSLVKLLGLNLDDLPHQLDSQSWDSMKKKFAEIFKSKTRDEWQAIFDGTDACVTPVLTFDELLTHSHTRHRNVLIAKDNAERQESKNIISTHEPAPAPRLSRTPGIQIARPCPKPGQHTEEVLKELGISPTEISNLLKQKVIWAMSTPTSPKL